MNNTERIRRYGKLARGQKEILKHLSGQRLTLKQAVIAHCYDCMGYFADGKVDCNMPDCPLYPHMAYNPNREKRTGQPMTKEHKQKMRVARQKESNLLL